ncbi:neuron navigator 2 isoform X4 [Siniperca chuatsi]|uniref:neuron navigator 2 isoform X4 n=1 Tax=Siniperca chuatsi TaxID=119488 RepID=UPI001CE04AD8|nr:neuron navigator 2 isoform X4 [Siniperca chuatsi]
MPAILVASKMKSGLPKPKPVHSALPIPQTHSRQPPAPVKTHIPSLGQQVGSGPPRSITPQSEAGGNSQIYTDWANHYLAKSGHKRLIKDLQTDVTDGVLLAEIIQVVANEKIDDINGCPKSRSQMIENIDACLSFLAAKGVNIQGLSSEEIRNGNLKAILGLFFSLSRYKQQQQQQAQRQNSQASLPPTAQSQSTHPPLSQQSSAPAQLSHSPHGTPALTAQKAAQAEMQSRDGSQSKLLKFSLGQKKTSRLPGPSTRVSTAGGDIPPRGSVSAAGNRRSQGFSDKTKANSHLNKDSSEGMTSQPSVMTEHPLSSAVTVSSSTSIPAATSALIPPPSSSSSSSSSTAIPQPNSKPWRSKSTSSKHTSSSSPFSTSTPSSAMQSVKQEKEVSFSCKAALASEAPPKVVTQKSMLEKLKLFNSKGGSKSSTSSNGVGAQTDNAAQARQLGAGQVERAETGSNTDPLEEDDGNVRPGMNGTSNGTAYGAAPSAGTTTVSTTASSPKIALKGIAQRTFSRALTAKKGSVKGTEKDKERGKEKEKGKEVGKRISVPDRTELRGEEPKEEVAPVAVDTDSSNKRTSKITSFIPKGGKVAKKESSTPANSGIPKPGGKAPGIGGKASSVKEAGERPRSMRLGGGLVMHRGPLDRDRDRDSRHSSSTSSLASTEGKTSTAPVAGGGTTQSTASNTVSVQLPQTQQHHSHPNTATVAPFMYRSQTDGEGIANTETGSGGIGGDISFTKTGQLSIEDLSGEDPETRRLRTVKNIADLRQNLEETMSSLRGTQVTHSTLETTFDGSVTTDINSGGGGGGGSNNSGGGRSILSLTSTRPSLSSWRLGQSSPRLQAGDAPSMGNSYGGRVAGGQGGRYLYPGHLRRQLAGRGGALCSVDLGDRAGEDSDLDGISMEVTGYMSDGDVLSKNAARTDDVTSGYMTDGGLGLYTRRLNRLPDSMAAVRETVHRNTSSGQGDADSWDDSSSVSSGISDNIDTDDINTSSSISSYANTPAAQRKGLNTQPVTDAEKHSASTAVHQAWSGDEVKRPDGGSDSGVRMEPGSKWSRRNPSDMSDESDKGSSGRKTPSVSHTGSWRRGMSTQVGVTSPRTKSTSSTGSAGSAGLKTHSSGKTDDVKVSEKGRLSPRPNGLHRSPSDAGRSSGDEAKKQSIPASRTVTTNALTHTVSDPHSQTHTLTSRTPTSTFGFKKQGPGMTMVTASGATITSGSATLGKMPKSGARSLAGGLKAGGHDGGSVLGHHDDGFLPMSARSTLQYRSLPRPSRSGAAARNGNRSSTSSIEATVLSVTSHGKNSISISKANGSGGLLANQTDREKGVSEIDNLRSGVVMQSGGAATVPLTGRQQVSSPTLRRLFGGKPSKQAPVTTAENMKNSTVISNPHATMNHVGTVLESPDGGLGGGDSETNSPLFGGRAQASGMGTLGSEQASSPGSVYSSTGPSNSLTWGTTFSSSSAQSREGTLGGHGGTGSVGYPSVSSMHTSSESIDMSLGSAGGGGVHGTHREDTLSALGRTGSVKTGMSESPLSSPSASPIFSRNTLPRKQDSGPHCGRNTLPKKGLRYGPSPQLRGHEEARDWLRSHSTSGLQDSAINSPFSPGSSLTSPSGTRFNFGQLASSPTSAAQINLASLRNNSLTNQDVSFDPCGDNRLRNSCMSLDEKTRTMSRSGSFRDGFEEVHGSSLSLVSSTSSIYSTNEEKSQSEIRKLRRELDASQEKVSALTTQLSANAHLVAAFEQSLGNMTIRLKSLTLTAEQKDSELNELRKTIELLKKQNAVAQAAINGVINTPELTPKRDKTAGSNGSPQQQPDLRIRRQHSSDSVSSITSATSHSSVGSNMDADSKNKKKNKKNWLRSSFKQAFSKKKSPKSASSHSDIEEMTDSSLPSSPKLPHNGTAASSHMLRNTHSNSLLSECLDSEAETVMQLRSELREKEMKLTDIRLEALSSAHQLDQLREAMNRMQVEIEKLKAENDRLKVENQGSRTGSQASISSSPPPHTHSQAAGTGPGLSQHSLNLTTSESTSLDMLLDDTGGEGGMRKEGRRVKMVVSLDEDSKWGEEAQPHHFLIGCIGVSGKTKWDVLDGVVRRLFKEYITHVDPVSQLGLSSDSVEGYNIGEIHRPSIPSAAHMPELLPCGYLVGDSNTINIQLKGVSSENVDSLVFDTLIPKPMLQRYISLLKEHRRVILSGPSGTGKTYLANQLSQHLLLLEGRPLTPHAVVTFNVDHKSSKELRQYLSGLAEQCSGVPGADSPLVVILDNLHHVSSLGEIFNGVFNCNYQHCPYIIGTMSQATSSAPNLQLHHNFRWVLCANHMEPVKGFLGRYLRRKLIEMEIGSRTRNVELVKIIDWIPRVWHHLNRFLETHSSSDVTIGPRLFLSCPIDVEGSRVWFTDLWNYSIIPYMLEAVREGLQLYGRRAAWEDPAAWVIDTYPWTATPTPAEWPPLLQLRPEDVGFDGYSAPREGVRKEPPQSDSDADPLMNMLMRLKEAATSSSPQSYDSDSNSNSHQDDILDSSLESTL